MSHLFDSSGRAVELEVDVRTARPAQELPPCPWQFPDPRKADDHGYIGEGGDFAPATIATAYASGIFPWPHNDAERLWFSPNPRAVIPLHGLHISRRLARLARSGKFTISIDRAFEDVMRACAESRPEGTWITDGLLSGYCELHRLGWAHSVEVWSQDGSLAGGLYGVSIGAMFGAESMFHRERDASKLAMLGVMRHALDIGLSLIDIQVLTAHTQSMGGVEIARGEYLVQLAEAREQECSWFTARSE